MEHACEVVEYTGAGDCCIVPSGSASWDELVAHASYCICRTMSVVGERATASCQVVMIWLHANVLHAKGEVKHECNLARSTVEDGECIVPRGDARLILFL